MNEITTLKRRCAEWNATEAELEALWKKRGKPQGAAWKKIATPIWDRQQKVEDALGPLLFKWAKKNRCVGFHPLVGLFTDNVTIRKETGLTMNGRLIRRLLEIEQQKPALAHLDKIARTMPEKKWVKYMDEFCTLTREGANTKKYLQESRERQRGKVAA